MLWKNFERRIVAVSIYINHAEKPGISNLAKSAYYRSAIILVCTIIEGVVYELVKQKTKNNNNCIKIQKELVRIHSIPKGVLDQENIVMAKEKEHKVYINDDGVGFMKLIRFLKSSKVVNKSEYEKLDYVRKERNKLHIQELSTSDVGYTKAKLKKVSEPTSFLVKKF